MARDWRLAILVPVVAVLGLAAAFATGALAAGKAADETAASGDQAEAGTQVAQAAAKKKHDPGEAQRTVDHAHKLIETGKIEQAVQALSATLAAGNLPPAIMARALLLRGTAYRQQKKPAQAIADFTSALWLKGGLSESDRADGLRQRAAAYQEAGLNQAGEIAPAGALAREGRPRERGPNSTAAPWSDGTTTSSPSAPATALNQEQGTAASSGGGWDLFANLFGGSGSAFAGQPAAAPVSPPPDAARILNAETSTAAPPARRTQASGWGRQTQVEAERSPPRVETGAIASKEEPPRRQVALAEPAKETAREAAKETAREAAKEAGKKGGHLRIQIAAVRTQAEAKALATRVMREQAATLAAHEPQIDQTVMGNMGSFYRVLIGPFASAQETQGVCAKLKGAGFDCLVTAQ
jgi:cell division septation protein DedD